MIDLKQYQKVMLLLIIHPIGMKTSKLVRLDILLNAQPVDALSALIHADNAHNHW